MRTDHTPQLEVIFSDDPSKFQESFNSKMMELSQYSPKYEFHHEKGFCAYIIYDRTTKVLETLADEYALKGYSYKCIDCPYLEVPTDKRIKHCHCDYAPTETSHKDSPACELFYKRLDMGMLLPVGETC